MIILTHAEEAKHNHIAALEALFRMVREFGDQPLMWKMNDPFLDAVCQAMRVRTTDLILRTWDPRYKELPIDISSQTCLISDVSIYPVHLVGYQGG